LSNRKQSARCTKLTVESLPALDITDEFGTILEGDETQETAPAMNCEVDRHPLLRSELPSSTESFPLDPSYIEPDGGSLLTFERLQLHDDKSPSGADLLSVDNAASPIDFHGSDYASSVGSLYSTSGLALSIPEKCAKGRKKMKNGGPRVVPSACAICLDSYEVDDRVVWNSCDTKCVHAFHETCITMWCFRKIEEDARCEAVLCPCCRQSFVTVRRDAEAEEGEDIDRLAHTDGRISEFELPVAIPMDRDGHTTRIEI
jgi:hypothetical protein